MPGWRGSATWRMRSPVTTGLPSQSLGSLYTATPARGESTVVRASCACTAASSARRCRAVPLSTASSPLLCGLSKARWLAASNSASATATSLASTSARLRRVVSSRANSGVPTSTLWFGRTSMRAITPSIGELITWALRDTTSAGASAVCRTGTSSITASTATPSSSWRRLGRQKRSERGLPKAAQQCAQVWNTPSSRFSTEGAGASSRRNTSSPRRWPWRSCRGMTQSPLGHHSAQPSAMSSGTSRDSRGSQRGAASVTWPLSQRPARRSQTR